MPVNVLYELLAALPHARNAVPVEVRDLPGWQGESLMRLVRQLNAKGHKVVRIRERGKRDRYGIAADGWPWSQAVAREYIESLADDA